MANAAVHVASVPDSLRSLVAVIDTLHVSLATAPTLVAHIDNIPASPSWWSRTWPLLVGALIGGTATIAAQGFRALIDSNREREEVRTLLLLLVVKLEGWLRGLSLGAHAWQLPSSGSFWKQCDQLLEGNDRLGRSLFLLPDHAGIKAWQFLTRVHVLRVGAQDITVAHLTPRIATEARSWTDSESEKYFGQIEVEAELLVGEAKALRHALNEAAPRLWRRRVGVSSEPFEIPEE